MAKKDQVKPQVEKSKVESKPKGGDSKKVAEPKVEKKVAEPKVEKKAEPKVEKKAEPKVEKKAEPKVEKKAEPKQKAGDAKPKVEKKDAVEEDDMASGDKRQRSFKVKLPGASEFTGRFTGLTPYQAGNKALSKYYRTTDDTTNNVITIEIQESTRNSKKGTYAYEGSRIKLDQPVAYTIKESNGNERVITKEFKNRLIKKKKSSSESA